MKYILALLITISFATAAEWDNPKLAQADPKKPVYQLDWGWFPPGDCWLFGGWSPKRIPSVDDMKCRLQYEFDLRLQEIQLKEIERGSFFFMIGCIAIGIGFALHFITSLNVAQRISEWVLSGGFILACTGLLMKKVSEYQGVLAIALCVGLMGFILYRYRNWSASQLNELFKRKDS